MTALLLMLLSLCPCKIERNPDGSIKRDWRAVREFARLTHQHYPRPGYVVDHIIPLCACGADDPSNMQWQRVDESRAKDRLEIAACNRMRSDQ